MLATHDTRQSMVWCNYQVGEADTVEEKERACEDAQNTN
jgi:hypothetical protein